MFNWFYLPKWKPEYVVENGVRRGPFLYSTKWLKVEEQAELLFGKDKGEHWREYLKSKAFNKSYRPPDNHIHLARTVIGILASENAELKEQLIKVKKELSQAKRNK